MLLFIKHCIAMVSRLSAFLLLALLSASTTLAQVQGVPTIMVVRAVSNDAKVIQDPVGGAEITITDVATGKVLSQGLQVGGSGDTDLIMRQPRERGVDVYDTPNAAAYRDTLYLTEPTKVNVTAVGPLAYPQAAQRASTSMLLVPGEHVLGDGVVLPIHGFIVEILEPSESGGLATDSIDVRARVRMTCGCPTTPGGLWDSDSIDIVARLVSGAEVLAEAPMRYAGTSSTYESRLPLPDDPSLELQVLASDSDRANFGAERREIRVR